MKPIFCIWRKSVTFKPRQDKTRHDKAWPGKARRGQTRRRPDKKVSPGFEKYCKWISFLNETLDKYDKLNRGYIENIRTADDMFILIGEIIIAYVKIQNKTKIYYP